MRARWLRDSQKWTAIDPLRQERPAEPGDEPDRESLLGMVAATKPLAGYSCVHCELFGLRKHFVTEDVFGVPTLYCLQRPCPLVVRSSGQGGSRKHWRSSAACHAVEMTFWTDQWGEEHIDFRRNRPLVADHVLQFEWCDRCRNNAGNIAGAASAKGMSPAAYVAEMDRDLLERRRVNRGIRARE